MNKKQNIILLTIDSLRADHLGCFGYFKDVSPNIDKLASEGVFFSQAISNGDATPSSFPPIITSSYPSLHLIREALGRKQVFLSSDRMTIAEVLKKNGYSTAAFNAKNPLISSFFHYDRGFDVFDDQMDEFFKGNKARNKILHSLTHPIQYCNWHMAALVKYVLGKAPNSANAINKKAISWLRKNGSSFFLWLHYMDVHSPYNSSSFVERMKAFRLDRKMRSGKDLSGYELRMLVKVYDDSIKYLDHEIGCFLNELERSGISCDDTYIIFTSDHGEQFMEHGRVGHGLVYDEVLHVPLVICGPGIEKNTVIKDQVSLLDIGPTIVDLLHIPKVKSFQGRSLLPLINGKDNTKRDVISEGSNPLIDNSKQFSFRTEEWKYILTLNEDNRQLKAELYNLHRDPGEKENLIEIEKTKAEEFRSKILNHIAMEERERVKTNETTGLDVYRIEDKRKIEERLKELGYI